MSRTPSPSAPASVPASAPTSAPASPVPGQPGFWRAMYHTMLAALADGSFMRFNGYTVPGRTFQYRSLAEFRALVDWVKDQADVEDGTPQYRGRMYAGQKKSGRGGCR